MKKKILAISISAVVVIGVALAILILAMDSSGQTQSENGLLEEVATISTKSSDLETVTYNADHQRLYLADREDEVVSSVTLANLESGILSTGDSINIDSICSENGIPSGGTIVAMDVSEAAGKVAVALDQSAIGQPSQLLLLSYLGDYIASYPLSGIPMQILFSSDGSSISVFYQGQNQLEKIQLTDGIATEEVLSTPAQTATAFDDDGVATLYLEGDSDGVASVWNETGETLPAKSLCADDLAIGMVDDTLYAAADLPERSEIVIYNINDPTNPVEEDSISVDDTITSLAFVSAEESPSDFALLIATNQEGKLFVYQWTEGEVASFTLLHTNDVHGAFSSSDSIIGADEVAGVKEITKNAVLVDGGDATQGSSLATLTKGSDIMTIMNSAGYQAMCLGNHEFDYGQDQLLQNAQSADFPLLSANTVKDGKPILEDATYQDGAKINNGANVMLEADDLKIGIFGITTPETATKSNPKGLEEVTFEDPLETTKAQVKELKDEGADVVIGLMHLGVDSSTETEYTSTYIAQEMQGTGLDIIVDGHSHTVLTQSIGDVLVQQTGSSGSHLGMINVIKDEEGNVTCEGKLLDKNEIEANYLPDQNVSDLVDGILKEQEEMLAPVVGQTQTTLWGGSVNGVSEARLAETNLGDLVTDGTRAAVENVLADDPEYGNCPVVALESGGSVRATIERGDITVGSTIDVLPFGNMVVYARANPAALYQAIENGVSGIESQNPDTGQITGAAGKYPQISGMRVEFNPSKPKGERVEAIYLDGSDEPLDRNDTTTPIVLVSSDFTFAGGDDYSVLTTLPVIGQLSDGEVALTEDTVFKNYVTSLSESGEFYQPVYQGRTTAVGAYSGTDYDAYVTVANSAGEPMANTKVEYQIDNGDIMEGMTDENGILTLEELPNGPHGIRVGDATDVLVNNYSGAGLQGNSPVVSEIQNTTDFTDYNGSVTSKEGSENVDSRQPGDLNFLLPIGIVVVVLLLSGAIIVVLVRSKKRS